MARAKSSGKEKLLDLLPDPVVLRSRRQHCILSVLEAMMDGDITDAKYYLKEWEEVHKVIIENNMELK